MNQNEQTAQQSLSEREQKLRKDYDTAAKNVLAEKPFLARIMKECMPEFHDCTEDDIINRYIEGTPVVSTIMVDDEDDEPGTATVTSATTNGAPNITGMPNEHKSKNEGTILYDIRFKALAPKEDELIEIIINVEAQNKSNPGYPLLKRAVYYCSRMISAQKNTEFVKKEYGKIKKVYSVWVCSNPNKAEANTIASYSIHENQLVGNPKRNPDDYDLMTILILCLGDAPQELSEDMYGEEKPNCLRMLELLLKSKAPVEDRRRIFEKEFNIKMTERSVEEVEQMCNLSQGLVNEGKVAMVKEMLLDNQPIELIVKYSKFTMDQIEKIRLELVPAT